jgi:hypothetical protein
MNMNNIEGIGWLCFLALVFLPEFLLSFSLNALYPAATAMTLPE